MRQLTLACLCCFLISCDDIKEITDNFLENFRTGRRALTDDDVFVHLSPDLSTAPVSNVSASMKVIDGEIKGTPMMEDPEVNDLLRSVVFERMNMREDRYSLVDFDSFGMDSGGQKSNCAFIAPDESLMYDDYMIPGVEKIPVRDQGYRGTCAAFAAIGNIEYAALNSQDGTPSSTLPTLDLSEQHFYWLSKEECQDPGSCVCPGCEEGSWYGTGLVESEGADDLDIPLETDCPYNNQPGDTDTQTPLINSCQQGAVQVEEVGSWCGMDDLIDLLNRGYAVPFASPLSGNWEANDGLITAEDLTKPGNSIHAGGHAYLIVGYRKLPEMPEEGGVCFYVKNSWGKGWGAGGFACQTLEWMRQVTFDGFISLQQPVAIKVKVREDLQEGEVLPDNDMAEEEESENLPEELEPTPEEEEEILPAPEPDLEPNEETEPAPEPEPAPPADMYRTAKLYGPNETYYEARMLERNGQLLLRGSLRKDSGSTKDLKLNISGDKLIYKGDVVGKKDGDIITLCTGTWGPLCSIRYRKSDQQMYLQFRDDDLRKVQSAEYASDRGEWFDLDLGQGRNYGLFIPTDLTSVDFLTNPKTFVRLGSSEPARVSLRKQEDSTDFSIKLSGQEVGILKPTAPTDSALCSGDEYGDKCQIRGLDRAFVLPRNSGSRSKRE